MIHCPNRFSWSSAKAEQRQNKAGQILGKKNISRIIGFALFLLGADRKEASSHVDIPFNTFLSFLTRMNLVGIDGFRDRRKSTQVPQAVERPIPIEIKKQGDDLLLCLGKGGQQILLNDRNKDHKKILLLSFAANGLISIRVAAQWLEYTEGYVRSLVRALSKSDVGAVLDQRAGQRCDYRVDAHAKGELISQWAAHAVNGESTSSPALSNALETRCNLRIPARTIRHHLKKLGLVAMKGNLKELTIGVKKGS